MRLKFLNIVSRFPLLPGGVPVRLIRCNGMEHGFLSMIGLVKRAEIYFDQVVSEIIKMAAA